MAAPPRPFGRKAYIPLVAVVAPLGVLYPLVGASLAIVLAFDVLMQRIGGQRKAA